MSIIHQSRRPTRSYRFAIALLVLACWPGIGATNDDPAMVTPDNAHMNRYDSGWEGDRGFRKVDRSSCVAVAIPSNAYLNAAGHEWKCDRGYRKADESCGRITVPMHAFLSAGGSEWQCDRG